MKLIKIKLIKKIKRIKKKQIENRKQGFLVNIQNHLY